MSRPRGRPRDADADERIFAAAYEVLISVGYQSMTIDEVVARAGVSKATLYRRWGSKEELVLRCLQDRAVQDNPPPTGDWRRDIEQAIESIIDLVNTEAGAAMLSVMAAGINNVDLNVVINRRDSGAPASIRRALQDGIDSGEVRPDLDLDLMMDLLVAVIPFRMTALGEKVESGLSKEIVRSLLEGALVRERP